MQAPGFEKRAAGRRLLIIDDDVDARQALNLLLSADGFRVTECGNGREALACLAASSQPDIILLDLWMPVMNGWEFRMAQRREPKLAAIPVVALSGDGTPQAAAIDADAYVKKPVDYQVLLGALDRLLISSEHRELQARLAQTDRLTSLGTLAAGVAHEVNNPLTYILLSLDYAAAQLKKGVIADSSEMSSAIEHAREGAERIRDIVGGLKTFSRPESESVAMLDVVSVLDTTLSMVGHELRHRGRLVKDYAAAPPVLANEAKLGQVFLNLILNAVQALPENRCAENEIRVTLRASASGRVIVEVRDNGIGIDPEVRGRIFEPFFTTKPVGIGTGLGLAICHGTVTSLGGTISVESEVGKGSAFIVDLPAADRAKRASVVTSACEVTAGRSLALAKGDILIIDDESVVCTSLQRLLSQEGNVVAVTAAREALRHVKAGMRFDVIVCDVHMPGMDAPALYEALWKIDPGQAERMVFMTGGAFTARAREFLERVPNARLSKPFDIEVLVRLVRARL
jgi:signal transduction histidine kinase